ncbi:Crp/Fnr family transcriptional regulator [Paenibacillus typhae]|uniref:cAMP-binding domain of CRP or a regulatory subunit of cAMP-dependent protein kinases n=1 Tax=Paenibacillus typhae TaxID=1174501 RepID=A0A1G8J9Q2_9BACL|nr:Crp/Fnr family transcriptional regulator [Paenibacillus typhae]SDI27999.1 cAMP-binding domain of CRP or a regulatory subunit of cAMP-dependent protein kinases [Paenibacillus typhae]
MKNSLLKYMTALTSLSEAEQQAILNEIVIEEFKKGAVLFGQGDVTSNCYFILRGCVRQYSVDEAGREVTSNFYTEEEAIVNFNYHKTDKSSDYTLVCVEDCVMVIGSMDTEQQMYAKYSQLETMTRRMVEANFSRVQADFAAFIASSPEERFKTLCMKRPSLIGRVPQHQLASYLGMSPESLSRIKKRISSG